MTNHLMSGHAAPSPLAVRTHAAQAAKHFAPGGIIQESFHTVGRELYTLSKSHLPT